MPNPRAQKPLTLDQVKKDLLSFKEPATALADMTAGGLRGLTLGTFGLPGEAESLGRAFINTAAPAHSKRGKIAPTVSEETYFPTIDELSKRWSPTIPEGVPDQKSRERSADFGETFGKLGVLPGTTRLYGGVYRGIKSIPAAFKHGALEFAKAAGQPSTNIVKSGGGNWLRQGLDQQRTLGDAGRGMSQSIWNRQPPDYQAQFPERQQLAVANDTVADWANNNMRKYMANQMGTKNDPVRKLAEQNISHFGMKPDEFGEFPFVKPSDQTKKLRKQHTERTGEESSMAESSLAQHWENSSDNAIKATTVGDIKNAPQAGYSYEAKKDIAPYVDKVPPETPIYNIDTGDNYMTARGSLGFNRMLEVMKEDIAAGRITPEEVAKWDMEQAVRHVDKRDKAIWKAEEEETDRLAKEFAKYFPTLKEYPDKSRWIELKVPEIKELPEGYKAVPYKSNYSEGVRILDPKGEQVSAGDNMDEALKNWGTVKLEEALAHEGEKMGHCVGSYCDDVVSGKSRVISYRDANGDPHVTLEVTPPDAGRYPISEEAFKALPSTQQIEYSHAVRQWRQRNPDVEELTNANISKALEEAGFQPRLDEIKQIKGKQDARPVDRYIPYVQDFQRTTNYPIEGDFANSGFVKQDGKYMTQAEYDDYLLNELKPPPAEGMKEGGAVHMLEGGSLPDFEYNDSQKPFEITKHGMKQYMNGNDVSMGGIGVNVPVDNQNFGFGLNSTSVGRDNSEMQLHALAARYGLNVNDSNFIANLTKMMEGEGYNLDLIGSTPIGQGRVSAGLHGSHHYGKNSRDATSLGYDTKFGGGNFHADVARPTRGGKPMANIRFSIPFAEGGAVHMSDNPDTMAIELQNQHYQAGGVVRGLKALKGALRDPDALVPSARGATKFADTEPKTMSVVKEKGGNWLGGNMSGSTVGNVDSSLKRLTPNRDQKETIAHRKSQLASMENAGSYSPRVIENAKLDLQDLERDQALNNWVTNNIGNYIKKDMATPTDPVRLMLEKRAQEIEAQFQVDMNRAERTRARAEAETDPRRQANLMRQATQQEEQAKFDRDFANEHVTHLPKADRDWGNIDEDALIDLKSKRERAGFDPEGMAKSEPAQQWENITDEAVSSNRAGDVQAQKDAATKAQDAERAFLTKDDEIIETFRPRLIETLAQRGESLSDKDLDALVKNLTTSQKAVIIGEGDTWNALRNEYQQASINVNRGLYGAYSENKWVDKLDPEANVYSAYIGDLGLDHVIDVIKQDVTAGRIRPEQLNKLSMDQAIQRTAEFNMEQAKKMRETAIRQTEGMPVYKDYGDEGYKWIELAPAKEKKVYTAETLPEGFTLEKNADGFYNVRNFNVGMTPTTDSYSRNPEESIKKFNDWVKNKNHDLELQRALTYEGDTMGHCVGGYCPDVIEGKSRIYSLRDKRGEPHVTIEVRPKKESSYWNDIPEDVSEQLRIQGEEIGSKKADEAGYSKWGDERDAEIKSSIARLKDDWIYNNPKISQSIRQIKGKGNARPVEKYDPYTQDFVRSGEWSDVGDIRNTGLMDVENFLNPTTREKYLENKLDIPRYATEKELDELHNEYLRLAEPQNYKPPEGEGMKAGGKVHVSDNCDCMQMELDNKKFAMGGAVESETDVGSPSPQNSASPVASFQAGGAVKGLAALKQALTGGSAEAAKAARVAALRQSGLSVAEAKARVELAEQAAEMKQALKASEALAKIEGKHLNITQADRTKVGEGYLGGPGFSGLQMKEGPHKDVGAVWGVKNTGTAKTMLGGFDKPFGNEYFTTMIGSPTQHQSNQMVFDKLYKDFTAQAKKGNLDPELRQKINDRLASAVDKDGNAIFPPDIDILSKNFKKQASTFDQRAVAGNVLGGVGIGGKKGQIIDYEKIIRDTTDPFLLDTPSGDLGYRLWTPSGEIIERPDLHPAFPTIATGEDLGVEFAPADKNVLLAPFLEKFRAEKGRDPGYMDMTRGRPARVQITEPLLKNLQESGNKAGGAVKAKNKYSDGGAISALMKHAETAGQSARMNNQRM